MIELTVTARGQGVLCCDKDWVCPESDVTCVASRGLSFRGFVDLLVVVNTQRSDSRVLFGDRLS